MKASGNNRRALVIGGSIEGVQAALDIADSGAEVILLEESSTLYTNVSAESQASVPVEILQSMPKFLKAVKHRNISIVTNAIVQEINGKRGSFQATVARHPRYVSLDVCTSCGRCELTCPVDIVSRSPESGHKAIHRPDFGLKSVPSTYKVDKAGVAPCTAACPAGINAHGYVALISKGKFAEALNLVTDSIPFPRVLGRVCSHPCEIECSRGKIDHPVSICALKRFVADNANTESSATQSPSSNKNIKTTGHPKVAIIGSGPAGLTAARDLARLGHRSTVFEALPVAGGMMAVGMPQFRLPSEVLQADINDILSLGVEIRTSTPIGKDLTLHDLQRQGYKAILVAAGAHENQKLNVPGENLSGIVSSIAFLRSLSLKQPVTIGSKVVVIGGGYTAIDSARTAIRLNCQTVRIIYRRSLDEMPADPGEVAEAQEEGVEIEYLVAPVRITGHEGKVTGVECMRMALGEPDKSGRRRPVPIEGTSFFIEADTVIVAVGQKANLSFLDGDTSLTDGGGQLVFDPHTMATEIPGVFAAGDVAGEPGSMVEAVASGRRAARSIDKFLRVGKALGDEHFLEKIAPVEVDLDKTFVPAIEHQPMPLLQPEDRVSGFAEVELGFSSKMAVREATRCLNCAGCSECLECIQACELEAIDHESEMEQLNLEADAIIMTGDALPTIASLPGVYHLAPPSPNGDLSHASAVAARVMRDLAQRHRESKDKDEVIQEADIPEPALGLRDIEMPCLETRVGVVVCGCGGNISDIIDVPDVVGHFSGLDGIAYSGEIGYACTDEAAVEIKDIARQHRLTHVVLAACACCNFDQICYSCSDRRVHCKSNLLDSCQLNGICYEFVNIREHCAWVHWRQPQEATSKARSLINAGIANTRDHQGITDPTLDRAIVTVDRQRCRGCGTCVSVCQFEAVALCENIPGVVIAQVDDISCKGCGICAAHCPSGALSQIGCGDNHITASLEAILS